MAENLNLKHSSYFARPRPPTSALLSRQRPPWQNPTQGACLLVILRSLSGNKSLLFSFNRPISQLRIQRWNNNFSWKTHGTIDMCKSGHTLCFNHLWQARWTGKNSNSLVPHSGTSFYLCCSPKFQQSVVNHSLPTSPQSTAGQFAFKSTNTDMPSQVLGAFCTSKIERCRLPWVQKSSALAHP